MAYFKDGNDGYYIIESNSDSNLIEITSEEYTVANRPLPPTVAELRVAKQSQIDALEASQYMGRSEREGWLAMVLAQAAAQNVPEVLLYSKNIFYKKLKDINTQVTSLRTELNGII